MQLVKNISVPKYTLRDTRNKQLIGHAHVYTVINRSVSKEDSEDSVSQIYMAP